MLIRKSVRLKTGYSGSRLMIFVLLAVTLTISSLGLGVSFGQSEAVDNQASRQNGDQLDIAKPIVECPSKNQPIGTGFNYATNSTYAIGVKDPNWVVIKDPDSTTTEPRPAFTVSPYPGWQPGLPGSQWISAYPDSSSGITGEYIFEYCFCLADQFVGPTLSLSLRADNEAQVFFNGTSLGSAPINSFKSTTPFLVPSPVASLFQPGKNCIRIVVKNQSGPIGLNVSGSMKTKGLSVMNPSCCPSCKLGGEITKVCCLGKNSQGQLVYAFSMIVNYQSNLSPPASCNFTLTSTQGNITSYTPTTLAVGNNTVTGTFTVNQPLANPFCMELTCPRTGCKVKFCRALQPC